MKRVFALLMFFVLISPNIAFADSIILYCKVRSLNVREGPGKNYKIIGTIKRFDAVNVKKSSNGWAYFTKTRFPSGGWVSKEFLVGSKASIVGRRKTKALKKRVNIAAESISYKKIDANAKNMTDAVFSSYAKSLVGKNVTWKGMVVQVKKNWLNSNYEVRVDMDDTGIFDVTFDVTKRVALQLARNEYYKFAGIIESVNKIFGTSVVNLEHVRFR